MSYVSYYYNAVNRTQIEFGPDTKPCNPDPNIAPEFQSKHAVFLRTCWMHWEPLLETCGAMLDCNRNSDSSVMCYRWLPAKPPSQDGRASARTGLQRWCSLLPPHAFPFSRSRRLCNDPRPQLGASAHTVICWWITIQISQHGDFMVIKSAVILICVSMRLASVLGSSITHKRSYKRN